jgi:hypothetical protein
MLGLRGVATMLYMCVSIIYSPDDYGIASFMEDRFVFLLGHQ